MAYEDYHVDEGKSAKFNAGVLQTQRINKILDLLNFAKTNPLAFNNDYNDWNFNIQLRQINILYNEIHSFLDKEEKEQCTDIYNKVREVMKKYPPKEKRKTSVGGSVQMIDNETNWNIIEKDLEVWERIVRDYGTKYQIITSTVDEDWEGL